MDFDGKLEEEKQGSSLVEEEKKQEESLGSGPDSQRTRQNQMYLTKADSDKEVIHKAATLAPIMDRVGRLISDFSP